MITWKKLWARRYAPFVASTFLRAFTKTPGYDVCQNKLYLPDGSLHSVYFDEQEFAQLTKRYIDFLQTVGLQEYGAEFEEKFRGWYEWARKANRKDWLSVSDKELIAFTRELADVMSGGFTDHQFFAFVVIEGPGRAVEEWAATQSNGQEMLGWIATPEKHTQITRARIELLKMVADGRVGDADLDNYLEQYSWLPVYEFIDESLTREQLRGEIAGITDAAGELAAFEQGHTERLQQYADFISTVSDPEIKKQIEIVHAFAYLKEMRDDYRRPFYLVLRPYWQEIERRTGLSIVDANYLLPEEIVEAVEGGGESYVERSRARQKAFSIVIKNGEVSIASEDLTNEFLSDSLNDTGEISGVGASPGTARGPVRVVYHKGEFEKFQDGDVLVTAMTHPEFLPIMKRAAAFVTDEGGVTCHAAITARELGKACVIGTAHATRVLKDGDVVEVDGKEGVVRRVD